MDLYLLTAQGAYDNEPLGVFSSEAAAKAAASGFNGHIEWRDDGSGYAPAGDDLLREFDIRRLTLDVALDAPQPFGGKDRP